MERNSNKSAFTLAEVMIVVVIIGVVVAMTLHTLHTKLRNHIMVNNLKVFYSDFQNVMNRYIYDNGYSKLSESPLCSNFSSDEEMSDFFIDNILSKYMKGEKGKISYEYRILGNGIDKKTLDSQFQSKKGYTIHISRGNWGSCVSILFDTNGKKGPNRGGLDIFKFYLYDDTTVPQQAYKSKADWNCKNCGDSCRPDLNSNASGNGCWARIIQNGWKINY